MNNKEIIESLQGSRREHLKVSQEASIVNLQGYTEEDLKDMDKYEDFINGITTDSL